METRDPEYIRVKDFGKHLTTRNLFLGTLINHPENPTIQVHLDQWERFPAIKEEPPFPGNPLAVHAEYLKGTNSLWLMKKTVLIQKIDSHLIKTIQFERRPSDNTVGAQLMRPEVCRALFGGTPRSLNRELPVYMVIGITIAEGARVRQRKKDYDRVSDEPQVPGTIPTNFENRLIEDKETTYQFGANEHAVIAYKLLEITGESNGRVFCAPYVDRTRVRPGET